MTFNNHPGNHGQNEGEPRRKSEFYDDVYSVIQTTANEKGALDAFRYRTFFCPRCHALLSATREDVGKKVVCPDCNLEVITPDYLDFDTPSEYERQYYDSQKRERDIILSPLTNPNREGLDTEGRDVYAVRGKDGSGASAIEPIEYYPVRCRVCETLMQATREMLGKPIKCPDCYTETIATDSLKRHQEALNKPFQPSEQGVYDVGQIPEVHKIAIQKMNGRTSIIDPKKKTIAPDYKQIKFSKQKSRESQVSYDEFVYEFRDDIVIRPEKGRIAQWLEKRAQRREKKLAEREDLVKFLPEKVLRRKNGELVWTLPSPPSKAPLFNKTFQAVKSEEIWTRGVIVVLCLLGVVIVESFLRVDIELERTQYGTIAGAFAQLEKLFIICFLTVFLPGTGSILGLYFWSVYQTGNSGAKKVVEWRKEDFAGFWGYGFWFLAFVATSCLPGTFMGYVIYWFSDEEWLALFLKATFSSEKIASILVFNVCFWFFFPIFWISTHQTDLPFCPITFTVFTSFLSKAHIWLEFYLYSVLFFLIPSVLVCVLRNTILFVLLAPVVSLLIAMFYGLFLGRLSWIIDDNTRRMNFDD